MAILPETGNHRIVLSEFVIIPLLAAHHMVVLLGPEGGFQAEFDGLATGTDGSVKPVGYLPSDRLQVHEFSTPDLYKPSQRHAVLFDGPPELAMRHWMAARAAGQLINSKNLPYPFLGLGKNSNSVATTLVACMKLPLLPIPGGLPAPFSTSLVLSQEEISHIQAQFFPPAGGPAVPPTSPGPLDVR